MLRISSQGQIKTRDDVVCEVCVYVCVNVNTRHQCGLGHPGVLLLTHLVLPRASLSGRQTGV